MNENIFDKLDFGPLRSLLDNDDITDISYDNGGQIWIRSLQQGSMRVEVEGATPEFVEKLAFQCSNVMGTTFNNAKPFLDAESAELRLNFVHQSIATNGIALVIRKTPAKIRLEKEKLLKEDYFTGDIHDFLIKCVEGHCNIMVAGETGSGKTEFVKYLASHTKTNEKIITIEDTLELHLDKIFPQRDIVAMKTNNVASYSDVLVTCMRQNPKWILLSEVRSAEAVSAVRNSISSGHNILSTIHADKAAAIPYRLYSLMETDLDVNQFLSTIYRYIQLGVHIKAYYSKEYGKFHRELDEVCEFYVDDNNVPQARVIYQKLYGKAPAMRMPSEHLKEYLSNQNIDVSDIVDKLPMEFPFKEQEESNEYEQYDDGSAHREDVTDNKATDDDTDNTNSTAEETASTEVSTNDDTSNTADNAVSEENVSEESTVDVNTEEVEVPNVEASAASEEAVNGESASTEVVEIPSVEAGTDTNTNAEVVEVPNADNIVSSDATSVVEAGDSNVAVIPSVLPGQAPNMAVETDVNNQQNIQIPSQEVQIPANTEIQLPVQSQGIPSLNQSAVVQPVQPVVEQQVAQNVPQQVAVAEQPQPVVANSTPVVVPQIPIVSAAPVATIDTSSQISNVQNG